MRLFRSPIAYDVLLRVVVVLHCGGWAWKLATGESPLAGLLFTTWDWSEDALVATARAFAILAGLTAILAALWPRTLTMLPWSLALAFLAICESHHTHRNVVALEFLAAIAAPLVLGSWAIDRRWWWWAGRVAVALTFYAHGVMALHNDPRFIDLLIGCGCSQAQAEILLPWIGWVDIAVAVLLLLPRIWLPVLAWAAAWGLLTAISRPYSGYHPVMEALLRASNGGLPLLLVLLYLQLACRRLRDAKASPETRSGLSGCEHDP